MGRPRKGAQQPAGQKYPGHALLKTLVDTVGRDSVLSRLVGQDGSRADYGETLKGWMGGRWPEPRAAWIFGEALRRTEGTGDPIAYSSGLLALYGTGREQHVIGVLGSCDRAALGSFEETLMALIRTHRAATYVSPYDKLQFVFPNLDDAPITADRLRKLTADSLLPRLKDANDLESIAAQLDDRRTARQVWTLPHELSAILKDGACNWFVSLGKGASQKTHPVTLDKLAPEMQLAHAVADSRLSDSLRDEFVIDALTRWFYEIVRPRRPSRDDVALWVSLVTDPASTTADAARSQLRSYILLAARRLGARIPDNTFDPDGLLLAVARHVAEESGIPLDMPVNEGDVFIRRDPRAGRTNG